MGCLYRSTSWEIIREPEFESRKLITNFHFLSLFPRTAAPTVTCANGYTSSARTATVTRQSPATTPPTLPTAQVWTV
ncbi:hypothetical protein CpipJ_CPIJ005344 [Culex quinquefasciatus]|uniref:Uncharacterized protein n=1 Tax=Culex quinquefasciatus TaxID=7176 RepID=B0WDK2_CULQU|nr:hypothetical protein CpipJ_CPIJ005344 [Culex quinquefasciatus]|eukprot:XP_001846786.1 hypothetical protein CpipJ_CPIJ005344 [Culex quinquefasciatus]